MFNFFSNVLNSGFISSIYPVGCFSYYCGPCLLPSQIILMAALKKKKPSQQNYPQKNPTGKQFGIKIHVWITQRFDYKLNCCNSSKMFSVAVSWWKSIPVSVMELPWLGWERSSTSSSPPPVQVRSTSQGNERSSGGAKEPGGTPQLVFLPSPRRPPPPLQLVLMCGFCHERA